MLVAKLLYNNEMLVGTSIITSLNLSNLTLDFMFTLCSLCNLNNSDIISPPKIKKISYYSLPCKKCWEGGCIELKDFNIY